MIRDAVARTPSVPALALSAALGLDIVLKLETLQRTGAFKERGAFYKLASLTEDERKRGVIAMSAGNHAQGVAYHAQRLGIPATIVMPQGTPFTKIERTAGYGARVVLRGENPERGAPGSLRAGGGRTAGVRASLRRFPRHRRPGHHRARNAGTDHPDLDVLVVPVGGGRHDRRHGDRG